MAAKLDRLTGVPRSPDKPLSITVKGVREKGQLVPQRPFYDLINGSISKIRWERDISQLIREVAKKEGPFSAAVHSQVEVANCSHLITAYNAQTHEFDPEATFLANGVIEGINTNYANAGEHYNKLSLEALKRHGLREISLTGAFAMEMVLDKARLPSYFQVVPFESIYLKSDGKGGTYPCQQTYGQDGQVDLNIPTFYLSYMQRDANSDYPFSMMESALKMIVYFEEFMEDIRRTVRQNGHTRTVAKIDTQKVLDTMPKAVRADAVKSKAYMDEIMGSIKTMINSLNPQDIIVAYDTVIVENLKSGLGTQLDYTPLLDTLSGMYATSMKTPPSAIGLRLEGSQALGNVESLIFIKTASALQTPFEDALSRALTLACRLHGRDVYVKFEFDDIDLRPETELQAFRTMEHQRIMELLSLGFITDEYAAHLLRLGRRPPGAPKLSGTMFVTGGKNKETDNTGNHPGDTPSGRTLQPDKKLPRKGGGKSQ